MSGLKAIARDWQPHDTRRTASFVFAVLCALASGSNYGYSAYAPQLASQLHLSSTEVNVIGTAGNLGMYLTGPVWGQMIDARGQQLPLLLASLLCFTGYLTVHGFYTLSIPIRAHPGEPESASHTGLFLLCLAMFFTGCGGSAGLAAAINAIAKSFSDRARASMTGAVLAGFGLSAFTFSTLGHALFGGEAGGLLLLLTFGTGLPLLIGSFVVRPVPPEGQVGYEPILDDSDEPIDEAEAVHGITGGSLSRIRSTSLELTRSPSPAPRGRNTHPHPSSSREGSVAGGKHARNTSVGSISPLHITLSPVDLIRSVDFWLLFAVLAILCGTGLMYINNAGSIALALGRQGRLEYDKKTISAWQARQVALVSIWNCLGRMLGGLASDFAKTRFKLQRIWFLPLVAFGFIASQILGMDTTNVKHLWIVSTILGLSYGSMFNVMPMLILEWFGMAYFSSNYGWITVAPVIGGNIFNLLFGRVYDSNTIGRIGAPEADTTGDGPALGVDGLLRLMRRAGGVISDDAKHDCLIGTQCYATAFRVSTLGCLVAFGLSVYAGFRRERKNRMRRSTIDIE